jgi:hypothetical protein
MLGFWIVPFKVVLMASLVMTSLCTLPIFLTNWIQYSTSDQPSLSSNSEITDETQFPEVSGYNLEGELLEFPRDFAGEYNIAILAYQQWQQFWINDWLPLLDELEAMYPDFKYYEIPVLTEMSPFSQAAIDSGMAAGIPSEEARRRTITLYIDVEVFNQRLAITDQETIYLVLVDSQGQIYWRTEGQINDEKAEQLRVALEALN